MTDYVTPRQFMQSEGVDDWRLLSEGALAFFRTGSFAAGARFVTAIAELPGLEPRRPDMDVRQDGVTVRLITLTEDHGGMSQRDVELARQISRIAQDEDLVDPHLRGPSLWFETMNEPRPDGGGAIHIAVSVPSEQAEARIAAALAAGGRTVRDDFAPAWWTLADAAGNEADIATVTGRG